MFLGYGKKLFDYMLMIESETPGHLAYDRPSPKFLQFLNKYYGLSECNNVALNYLDIPQVNNFVIFKQYGLENLNLGKNC